MASSIFYNGKVVARPGSYSVVDASGLEQVGLSASGIVAFIGTAVGGVPITATTQPKDFIRFSQPEKARSTFKSGDLREAAAMAFEPSKDSDIPGGAAEIVCMKVNQAAQSSRTFSGSNGTALTVTSSDYGEFTNQISVEQVAGTEAGTYLLTVRFEDTTETEDNIGGDEIIKLIYREPTAGTGWDEVRAQVLSSGLVVQGTRREIGLSGHTAAEVTPGNTIQIDGTASDAGKTITVYGRDTSNNPVRETLTLNGSGDATGAQTWNRVLGAQLSSAAVGAIDVKDSATTLISFVATNVTKGIVLGSTMFVANSTLSLVSSAAPGGSDTEVHLWGKSSSGLTQSERVVITAGSTYYVTSASWSQIDVIVLGGFDAAAYVLVAGSAIQTTNTTQNTVKKLADYVNARQAANSPNPDGFELTIVTGNTSFLVEDLDLTASAAPAINADFTQVLPTGSSVDGVEVAFKADLKAILDFYDTNSELVDADEITFAPKTDDVNIDTITNSVAYTISIDSFSITYTSDSSATVAEIQAGLIAAINNDHRVNHRVLAAAQSTNKVRVTAKSPYGYVLTEADAKISTTSVQSTAGQGSPASNTTMPEFLTGGSEGTATFSDWQNALNALKKIRVNTIVPLTGDPAVHAALDAHCVYMAGLGRDERDAVVGLSALDGNDAPTNAVPSKTSLKEQIVNLNSRHIRACAQTIDRFDTGGERETFLPWFQAAIVAGMQAGSGVGTPLTFKYANVLDIDQASSWNPLDDAEELIQGGLCFMERVDGVGHRVVRNVTTWLKDNNLAYTEASVNQAVNFAVYEFRTGMEAAVGKKGFSGTLASARNLATSKLNLLVQTGAIVAWRALSLTLSVDVLEVSVELAPIIPVNFVKSTIHLVTLRQAA